MLIADARLDLARAGVRVGERGARGETEREERDQPLGPLRDPQPARLASDSLTPDPATAAGLAATAPARVRVLALGPRLEVRLLRRDRGNRRPNRALDLFGDLVSLFERQVARKLQVQRNLD